MEKARHLPYSTKGVTNQLTISALRRAVQPAQQAAEVHHTMLGIKMCGNFGCVHFHVVGGAANKSNVLLLLEFFVVFLNEFSFICGSGAQVLPIWTTLA